MMDIGESSNRGVERTGGSRLAHLQFERQRRLPPVAHAGRHDIMRAFVLTLTMFLITALAGRPSPPTINGAWVLSEKWTGFMGVALVIQGNEFKYWFYSDVKIPNPPAYPITGKVEFDAGVVRLHPHDDRRLYDTSWHLVVFQGEICLLADRHLQAYRAGEKFADDRLLHKIAEFDEKKPVMNRPLRRP
jgi:hypothetical protein